MHSYYEINVSLNGQHFFATAPRSAVTKESYQKILDVIRGKFPQSEGYWITAVYVECAHYIQAVPKG